MFKELRKITLKSLPQGKDYIALVDNEKCIGCTQCVYYCNFASIDMISWDLKARTSQFESITTCSLKTELTASICSCKNLSKSLRHLLAIIYSINLSV